MFVQLTPDLLDLRAVQPGRGCALHALVIDLCCCLSCCCSCGE